MKVSATGQQRRPGHRPVLRPAPGEGSGYQPPAIGHQIRPCRRPAAAGQRSSLAPGEGSGHRSAGQPVSHHACATRSGHAAGQQPSVSQPARHHACASSSGFATGQRSGLAPRAGSGHRPAAPGEGFTVPAAQVLPPASGQQTSWPATMLAPPAQALPSAIGHRPDLAPGEGSGHQPPATSHRPAAPGEGFTVPPAQACNW